MVNLLTASSMGAALEWPWVRIARSTVAVLATDRQTFANLSAEDSRSFGSPCCPGGPVTVCRAGITEDTRCVRAPCARQGGVTLNELQAALAAFSARRDWEQFHTPKNLAMALAGE